MRSMEHSNHHHHKMMADFKRRFVVCVVVSVPVLFLSPMIQTWLFFHWDFTGRKQLLFLLSSFLFFYGGWPFLTGLKKEWMDKKPGMMTLIAMAITVSYLYSSATVWGLEGEDFFWELATLIDIMLLGHYIEMKATLRASEALEGLTSLLPDDAHLIKDGQVLEVKISSLIRGDRLLIKPGEKIPADGIVLLGVSHVNEAMISGESLPVKKEEKDYLVGGSLNEEGAFEMEVTDLGADSYLSKVADLIRQAQASSSRTQNLANRAAAWLTLIALLTGIITFMLWYHLKGELSFALARMASVMVIACPHALGLAMPLVVATSVSQSAKKGILIKNRTAFESSRKVDTLIFDKTGTLTLGSFGISHIEIYKSEFDEKRILQYAAGLEQNSEHPLARGIIQWTKKMGVSPLEPTHFEAMKGRGVKGVIASQEVMVVSPGFLSEKAITIPESASREALATTVFLLIDGELVATLSLSDELRKESVQAVRELKEKGYKVWMLTGDSETTAKEVAKRLDLDGYCAQVLPHEKEEIIQRFQARGHVVAMVGDGVNDAPALARADLGIAIGSGTDIAAQTADIILVNSNPKDVITLLSFGKASYRKMLQNLFWATAYNVLAIPMAAGVLYRFNLMISPSLGAVLMSLSTVVVSINARTLKID